MSITWNRQSNDSQLSLDFDDDVIRIDASMLDDSMAKTAGSLNLTSQGFTISSGLSDTITLGATGSTSSMLGGQYNYNYATPTITMPTILTTGTNGINWSDLTYANTGQGALQVKGDAEFEGDIKIKGKSLVDSLEKIEEKLAILRPNKKLEEKWEELRDLRKRYMELEAEIIEKEKMWDILKK